MMQHVPNPQTSGSAHNSQLDSLDSVCRYQKAMRHAPVAATCAGHSQGMLDISHDSTGGSTLQDSVV